MTQPESRGRVARKRLFLCQIALLLVGGSVAGGIPLGGQDRDLGKITKSGARPLRIAIVQMKSLDHDIDGNLRQATTYAEEAAARGAQFVLYPEFMSTGSYLSSDTWDFAEPSNGQNGAVVEIHVQEIASLAWCGIF
jgi:hypothetical protein